MHLLKVIFLVEIIAAIFLHLFHSAISRAREHKDTQKQTE